MTVTVDGSSLTTSAVVAVAEEGEQVRLSRAAVVRMKKFRAALQRRLDAGEVVYGVNTGFGSLSTRGISRAQIKQLQVNLIRSHATGTGEPLPARVVRAAMLVRLNSMANGNSGVRPAVAELLVGMLNRKITPYVPRFGSLGASGDLAPSGHVALSMMGEGKVYLGQRLVSAAEGLSRAGLKPVELEAKEGLSLINGTCFTTALACVAIRLGRNLLSAANSSAALTCEVEGACLQSFDARLMKLRRFDAQARVAAQIKALLRGSGRVRSSPVPQDPYSLRCAPQVHGATLEALDFAERIVAGELNAVTDNPTLVEGGRILHGGNFHAQPLAMVLDLLSIALSYLGNLSLARTHLMLSNSPKERKYGARNPGLESGLLVTEYTATALAAANAQAVYPSSTFPANVSAGIDDHASHGVNAGLKALTVAENVSGILSVELVAASNLAAPFEGRLSRHSILLRDAVGRFSPPLTSDRSLSDELEKLSRTLLDGGLPHPSEAE